MQNLKSIQTAVQETDGKIWGLTAAAALVGGVVVTIGARSVLSVIASLASPPVSLTVGAIGGGVFGWRYARQVKQMHRPTTSKPGLATTSASNGQTQEIPIEASPPVAIAVALPPPTATDPAAVPSQSLAETGEEQPVADQLEIIHGIGPVVARHLRAGGIQTLAQLADLSPEQVSVLIAPMRGAKLLDPAGWIAEARRLSAADKMRS